MVWNDYREAKQRLDKAQKALEKKPDDKEAQNEYWSARQLVKFHWRMVRFCLSLISQVISALRKSDKQSACEQLDEVLQKLRTLPSQYQAFAKKLTNFINNYRQRLLLHLEITDLDWTTNSCEAVFSLLRRFTIVYKCFPNEDSTNRFFSLFILYYNLKQQHYSDGTYMTPLAKAGIQVKGSYLYYLGYAEPPQIIPYSKLALQATQTLPLLQFPSRQKVSTTQTVLPLAA